MKTKHYWSKNRFRNKCIEKVTYKKLSNIVAGVLKSIKKDHPGAINFSNYPSIHKRFTKQLYGFLVYDMIGITPITRFINKNFNKDVK